MNSAGEALAAHGVTQTVYMGSNPRVLRNAPFNALWPLADPEHAGPRNFQKRYGYANVSSDNPAHAGQFAPELYSAGTAVGEGLSPQAVQILVNTPGSWLFLGATYRLTPQDLADLENAADPSSPLTPIFRTQVADLLAAIGQPGPKTQGPSGPVPVNANPGHGFDSHPLSPTPGTPSTVPVSTVSPQAPTPPAVAPPAPLAGLDPKAALIRAMENYLLADIPPTEALIFKPILDQLQAGQPLNVKSIAIALLIEALP